MRTGRLPTSWPPGADLPAAVGYLVARHVPVEHIGHGRALLTTAAGWSQHDGPDPAEGTTAGIWLRRMRDHARRLGPHPHLHRAVRGLGDGVIRSEGAAVQRVAAATAGDGVSPRVVTDLARWAGLPLPYEELLVTSGDGTRSARAYCPAPALQEAQRCAGAAVRRHCVLRDTHLRRILRSAGVRIDPHVTASELRDLLRLAGHEDWHWSARRGNRLDEAVRRTVAALGSVRLRHLPLAAARVRPRYGDRSPIDPPPQAGIRVWLQAQPRWRLDPDGTVTSAGDPGLAQPADLVVVKAAREAGGTTTSRQLRAALLDAGYTSATTRAVLGETPVLRPVARGRFRLLDRPPTPSRSHA